MLAFCHWMEGLLSLKPVVIILCGGIKGKYLARPHWCRLGVCFVGMNAIFLSTDFIIFCTNIILR